MNNDIQLSPTIAEALCRPSSTAASDRLPVVLAAKKIGSRVLLSKGLCPEHSP